MLLALKNWVKLQLAVPNVIAGKLSNEGISSEVIDLRILNPFDASLIVESVKKTKKSLKKSVKKTKKSLKKSLKKKY